MKRNDHTLFSPLERIPGNVRTTEQPLELTSSEEKSNICGTKTEEIDPHSIHQEDLFLCRVKVSDCGFHYRLDRWQLSFNWKVSFFAEIITRV